MLSLVSFGLLKTIVEQEALLDFAGVASLGDPAAFPLFTLFYTLVSSVTGLASAYLSRAFERQADLFALAVTPDADDFIAMFRRLSTENLLDLTPPPLNRLRRSHPPFAERMAMGRAWGEGASAGAGDSEEVPVAGDALQFVDPALLQLDT